MDTEKFNPAEWMTATEAAAFLDISRQAVEQAAIPTRNRGAKIRSMTPFKTPVYNRHDVEKYQVRPKYRKETPTDGS